MTGAPRKPLIIFDLVATLTDAGPRYAEAFRLVCEQYNIAPPSKDEILAALGNKNLKQIIAEYAPSLPEDAVDDFMCACNGTCDGMLYDTSWHEDLYPNVRKAVKDLNEKGYALGIYTGTRDDALESQLRYHNIKQYFDTSFIRAKNNERDGFIPNDQLKTAQLESILESYGGDKGDVVVVGDSKADMDAANALGLKFIGFAPTPSKAQCLGNAGVTEMFSDYQKLTSIVEKQFARAHNKPTGNNAPSQGPRKNYGM